jgi:hypothetical protein
MRILQKTFEEFKKDNKELYTAELSFEAQDENQSTPRLSNNDHNLVEETKKTSANKVPVQEEQPAEQPISDERLEPESVMDRQMDLLVNRLLGIINDKRYLYLNYNIEKR